MIFSIVMSSSFHSNLLVPLLYYINLRSSINYCIFSGDIFFWLVLLFFLFVNQYLNYSVVNFLCNYVILSNHQLLCCFFNYFFWSSFRCTSSRCFSMIKKFLALSTTYIFIYIFTNVFVHTFNKKQSKSLIYRFDWSVCHFLC